MFICYNSPLLSNNMYIPIYIIYLGNVWDQLNQLTAPLRNFWVKQWWPSPPTPSHRAWMVTSRLMGTERPWPGAGVQSTGGGLGTGCEAPLSPESSRKQVSNIGIIFYIFTYYIYMWFENVALSKEPSEKLGVGIASRCQNFWTTVFWESTTDTACKLSSQRL